MTVSSQLPWQPPDDARDVATAWSSRRETSTGALSVSVIIAAYAEDRWHDTYRQAPADGRAWITGRGPGRVFRGGFLYHNPRDVRAGDRGRGNGGVAPRPWVGFRLARTL